MQYTCHKTKTTCSFLNTMMQLAAVGVAAAVVLFLIYKLFLSSQTRDWALIWSDPVASTLLASGMRSID